MTSKNGRKSGQLTDRNPRGQFVQGNAGRPKGTSRSAKLRKAIDDDLPVIIDGLVAAAKAGDTAAAKLLLDRAIPTLKPQAMPIHLPPAKTLTERAQSVLDGTANGTIPADIASALIAGIARLVDVAELDEIRNRLDELEGKK